MCGIVGFVGKEPLDVFNLLKNGLLALEHRGYDSAGIATPSDAAELSLVRCVGSVSQLELEPRVAGRIGIGHTRWASHGKPSVENAHPHRDCSGDITLVHNGTIENFAELKAELVAAGHAFRSETDTEVLAHLIEDAYADCSLKEAVAKALAHIVGAYAVVVFSRREPDTLVAAKLGSRLVLGLAPDSFMVSSEPAGFGQYCARVIELADRELITVRASGYSITTLDGESVTREDRALEETERYGGRGAYPHDMLKEIYDQPNALQAGLAGRLDLVNGVPVLGGIRDILTRLQQVRHIILTGCGTTYHAALYGKHLMEQLLDVPVRAEISSELFFQKVNEPPEATLCIFLSQSGETMDTKEPLVELKRRGFLCVAITNQPGTAIPQEAGVGIFIRAGYEKAVASTKAFTSQMMALVLLSVTMARQRGMSRIEGQQILEELLRIPLLVQGILDEQRARVQALAHELAPSRNLFFLGKKYSHAIALEAALKVKEITYIPTEAYATNEMKHGPLALVDADYVAFVVAPEQNIFGRSIVAANEITTRRARVFLVTSEGLKNHPDTRAVHETFAVPDLRFNFLYPFLTVIPFQLLAYEIAVCLGRGQEIDRPRNLAKALTTS